MHPDKFIEPIIDFFERNFQNFDQNVFYIFGDNVNYPVKKRKNVLFSAEYGSREQYVQLAMLMNGAKKIVLHGLFIIRVVQMLAIQPWLLGKCYWLIWGGDLYDHKLEKKTWVWFKNEAFRRFVIQRLGHLVTFVEGDVCLARKWYGASGRYHECNMYTSNLYSGEPPRIKNTGTINIQIGNSATWENEHIEVLARLAIYKDEDIKIFVPLSYGVPDCAERVVEFGERIFGEKFHPISTYIPAQQYLSFLSEIDVAIFNFRRQQGMGNIINLLGFGKKVYLRDGTTHKEFFDKGGISVYSTSAISLDRIPEDVAYSNSIEISRRFNGDALKRGYLSILND